MSKKPDGGPAFPTDTMVEQNPSTGETTLHQYLSDGMSLRDYFAAKAMQSLFDSDAGHSASECQMIAMEAYVMADEMLKAREQ